MWTGQITKYLNYILYNHIWNTIRRIPCDHDHYYKGHIFQVVAHYNDSLSKSSVALALFSDSDELQSED